jgi:hypothetical protein
MPPGTTRFDAPNDETAFLRKRFPGCNALDTTQDGVNAQTDKEFLEEPDERQIEIEGTLVAEQGRSNAAPLQGLRYCVRRQ